VFLDEPKTSPRITLITPILTDPKKNLDGRDAALLRLTSSGNKTTSSVNEYCGPQPPSAAHERDNVFPLTCHPERRSCARDGLRAFKIMDQ
jgi:hypothetical protein